MNILKKAPTILHLQRGDRHIIANTDDFKPLLVVEGIDRVLKFLNSFPTSDTSPNAVCSNDPHHGLTALLSKHSLLISDSDDTTGAPSRCERIERCSHRSKAQAMSVYLLLSQSCNLNCVYCLNGNETYRKHCGLTITPNVAYRAIDLCCSRLSKNGTLEIILFGGEPLLNWNTAKEVIEYVENTSKHQHPEIDFKYHITSNLTFLPRDFFEWAHRYNFSFLCDIDGPEKIHNQLRPTRSRTMNSFAQSARSIEKLSKRGFRVALRATITSTNVEHMREIAKTHKELGGVNTAFVPLNPVNSDEMTIPDHLYPNPEKYAHGLREVFASGIWEDPETIYPFNQIMEQMKSNTKNRYGCGAPLGNTPVVTADGEIYPCIYWVGISRLKIGDIYNGYNESSLLVIRDLLEKCDVDNSSQCSTCDVRYICGGGCPVRKISVYNNPNANSSVLEYANSISCVHSKIPIEEVLWHRSNRITSE